MGDALDISSAINELEAKINCDEFKDHFELIRLRLRELTRRDDMHQSDIGELLHLKEEAELDLKLSENIREAAKTEIEILKHRMFKLTRAYPAQSQQDATASDQAT